MKVKFTAAVSVRVCFIALICLTAAGCTTGPDLTNLNKPTPADKASGPAEKEISGTYAVSGAGENGQDPYEGSLTVANQGDTYKVELQTARLRRTGVGVQFGDSIAVTYAEAGKGTGCGVALYRIGPNGALDARIAKWGETGFASEHAQQVEGSNFDGKYTVNGNAAAGTAYEGTMDIRKNIGGYRVNWHTRTETVGYGIWRGSIAAIGYGGAQCYFAIYDIRSKGLLEGFTGGGTSFAFGTETARKP